MVRTILAILSGLVVIVRQVMEALERRRLAEEREAQRAKDEEHAKEVEKLEENPADWFADHFGGDDPTRVVRPPAMPTVPRSRDPTETDADD